MSIHERLEELFRSIFHEPDLVLRDEMSAKDIPAWDSAAHINLMFGIESEFGFQFAGNELAEMSSIGALKEYLARVCPAAAGE